MNRGQDFGIPFVKSGTAVSTSATATQAVATGYTNVYVTDISASSDVGTATVEIRNASASILWTNTINNSAGGAPLAISFTTPRVSAGTVSAIVAGGTNNLKTVNILGYSL